MIEYPDTCKICGQKLVHPRGPKSSPVLIIGEFPGWKEMQERKPWVGEAGKILKTELAILGIDLASIRITNLWLHSPNDNLECKTWNHEFAIKEAKGKEAVLLIGSGCAEFFTDRKISELCGLKYPSQYIETPNVFYVVNPAQAISSSSGLGEVQFGLQKFAESVFELLI